MTKQVSKKRFEAAMKDEDSLIDFYRDRMRGLTGEERLREIHLFRSRYGY